MRTVVGWFGRSLERGEQYGTIDPGSRQLAGERVLHATTQSHRGMLLFK